MRLLTFRLVIVNMDAAPSKSDDPPRNESVFSLEAGTNADEYPDCSLTLSLQAQMKQ